MGLLNYCLFSTPKRLKLEPNGVAVHASWQLKSPPAVEIFALISFNQVPVKSGCLLKSSNLPLLISNRSLWNLKIKKANFDLLNIFKRSTSNCRGQNLWCIAHPF